SAHKDRIIHHLGVIQPLLFSAPVWCNILAHMLTSASSVASATAAANATITANAATAAAAAKALAVAAEAAAAQHLADAAKEKAMADAAKEKATAHFCDEHGRPPAASSPLPDANPTAGVPAPNQTQDTASNANKERGPRSIQNSVGARSIGAPRSHQRSAMGRTANNRDASPTSLPSPTSG
ncbi:hypothetical protein DUNSADRAFT_16252, partial [Dunaliella salina]